MPARRESDAAARCVPSALNWTQRDFQKADFFTYRNKISQQGFPFENFISDCNPFNHSASSLEGAVCVKDFEKIGGKFEKILSKENIKKSERVQLLEKSFTKRELAILSLVAAMQASM